MDSLPPEQDERGLVQALDAVVDQGDRVPKSTERVSSGKEHLRLRCLDPGRILVFLLEVGEESLAWRGGVGILPRQHRFDAEVDQAFSDLA